MKGILIKTAIMIEFSRSCCYRIINQLTYLNKYHISVCETFMYGEHRNPTKSVVSMHFTVFESTSRSEVLDDSQSNFDTNVSIFDSIFSN